MSSSHFLISEIVWLTGNGWRRHYISTSLLLMETSDKVRASPV